MQARTPIVAGTTYHPTSNELAADGHEGEKVHW
jgi:hypothetical protein